MSTSTGQTSLGSHSSFRDHFSSPSTFFGDAFSLSLPEEWKNETVYQLREADSDTLRIEMSIDRDLETRSELEYGERQVDVQLDAVPGGRVLDTQLVELDGAGTGYWVLTSWSSGDESLVRDQLFVVQDEVGYRLTVTTTRDERLQLQPQIERTFRSFHPSHTSRSRRREEDNR